MLRPPAVLLLSLVSWTASAQAVTVDRATVEVQKREGQDWCLLDSQASSLVPVGLETLAAVIQDYSLYTQMFPRIHEAHWETVSGDTLLSETVVVSALGITSVNHFTLRLTPARSPGELRLTWTQDKTDGTIDSLEGSWVLEDRGTSETQRTLVTYHTRSAVPVRTFGQDIVLRMFLGGETKAVVDAVIREAQRLPR